MIAFGLLWLPLVVLSLCDGGFAGTNVAHPLIADIVPHVRFLIVAPMLLIADLVIDPVTNISVRNIKRSGIVPGSGKPGLQKALNSLHRRLLGAPKPLDLLLEKTPFRLTDYLIPGHFGHVAIWMGNNRELDTLGFWAQSEMQEEPFNQYPEQICTGHSVLGAALPRVPGCGLEDRVTVGPVRFTISPDQVASQALIDSGVFELIVFYHDGELVNSDAASGAWKR